ncbi:MAG: hypothetical protein QOE83_1140 [Actinomycetota bacterium]|jgi:Tol biopolymer transport system component|nr:hypothetical protein [Actinomycetota bacterium]
MNANGTGRVALKQGGLNVEPVWSPDGTRIAYTDKSGLKSYVYTMNANGSGATLVKRGYTPDWQPA